MCMFLDCPFIIFWLIELLTELYFLFCKEKKKHILKKWCVIIGRAEPGFQFVLEGKDLVYSDFSPVETFGPLAFGFGYISIIRYHV